MYMEYVSLNISAVICTYNVGRVIKDTLDCLFASSYKGLEVIVVDDASTDDTVEVCSRYPVTIIRLDENRGPSYCRNLGVRSSRGDVIFFLDSDVTFGPGLLGRMAGILEGDPGLSGVGTISGPDPLNPGFYPRYFALQRYLLYGSLAGNNRYRDVICTRCGLLKRPVFDEVGGFDESYRKPSIEDYDFSVRMRGRHKIYYDMTLRNNHYWPDSFMKIFRRYYRNTSEMIWLKHARKASGPGLFGNEARAQVLIVLSGLSLAAGALHPPALALPGIFLAMAAYVKRDFLASFYRLEGFWFTLQSWACYCLFSVSIGAGILSGQYRKLTCLHDGHDAK